MYWVGARELRQHTEEVIARVQRGERILLTLHGAPIALISPIDQRVVVEGREQEALEAERLGWLKLSESAFSFWGNEEDAVWDRVDTQTGL
jgi:prevent-host-death family protein